MTTVHSGSAPGNDVARAVFAGLPRRYDRLAALLSFGQDRRWRRAVVVHLSDTPRDGRILDVATGPAGVALEVARTTGCRVVGVDLNEPMLREGARNVRAAGRTDRVRLLVGRAEQLPFRDASFDGVSFSYLLRYVDDPAATIAEMTRCLRPGGTISGLEFFVPPARAWRWLWGLYTALLLPVAAGLLGGRPWWGVGRFLGPSIRGHYRRYPLDWHVSAWQAAGLASVGCRVMSVGGGLVMWGTKPADP